MRLASAGGIDIFLETCYPLCESESYAAVVHVHKIRDSFIADECMTAVTSEFDMDEGRAPEQVRTTILLSPFFAAEDDIGCFGGDLVSVGIPSRKEGYVS